MLTRVASMRLLTMGSRADFCRGSVTGCSTTYWKASPSFTPRAAVGTLLAISSAGAGTLPGGILSAGGMRSFCSGPLALSVGGWTAGGGNAAGGACSGISPV